MLRAAIDFKICILQRHISTKAGCRLVAAKPRTRVRTRMITHARTLGTIPSSRCQTTSRASAEARQDSFFMDDFSAEDFDVELRQGDRLGGASRDRTDDLMLAKHALSQLSYGPSAWTRKLSLPVSAQRCRTLKEVVGLGRFELPTSRLSSARSNQLSYKP